MPRTIPLAALAFVLAVPGEALPKSRQVGRCSLAVTTVEDARTKTCLGCHTGKDARNAGQHPVDIDYATMVARTRRPGMSTLRPAHEVVAQGVFLPDGKITCITCHDARSALQFHVAVPANAKPVADVNARELRTDTGVNEQPFSPDDRARIAPTLICRACHVME